MAAWLASAAHRRAVLAIAALVAAKHAGHGVADSEIKAMLTLIVTIGAAVWVPAATIEAD